MILILLLVLEYGKVVDVRINRKNGRGEVPNFGFVVFDSADAVTKALAARVSVALMRFFRKYTAKCD